jgi:hypothetical protein
MFLLLCISQTSLAFTYTVEISEQELQEKLVAMMPLKKKAFIVDVVISKPVINLLKTTNKIAITADLDFSAGSKLKGHGTTQIEGSLIYNSAKGTFHISKANIVSLNVDNLLKKYQSPVKKLAQKAIRNLLTVYPVYTLKDDSLRDSMAKAVLSSVDVENETLILTLKAF